MSSRLRSFVAFWYDFVIGGDWRPVAMVTAGLAVTALLAHVAAVPAWWVVPIAVFASLAWSLRRATGRTRP